MLFLYYFPETTRDNLTPAVIRKHGLDDVFRDALRVRDWSSAIHRSFVTRGGPDGGSGTLCIMPPAGELDAPGCSLDLGAQAWHKVGATGHWVGWWKDRHPVPDGLLRRETLTGYPVELLDGNVWDCPTARRFVGGDGDSGIRCNVPMSIGIDLANGLHTMQPRADWLWAWDLAGKISDTMFRSGVRYVDLWELAVQALGVNYRVGRAEASLLGLFDTKNLESVFDAYLDMPKFLEMAEDQKKSGSDSGLESVSMLPG